MTPTQAAQKVAQVALSQVGYKNQSGWSKYGNWFHPNFAYELWCAMFASWVFVMALGKAAALRLIGQTYSWQVGHAWTVAFHDELIRRGAVRVSFEEARAGDIWFWRFGRSGYKVDHVDVGVGKTSGGYGDVVGGNTPQPGTVGDPRNGRGVWRHKRSKAYWNTYGYVILRPAYARVFKEAVKTPPTTSYKPRNFPLGMGQGKKSELSKLIQDALNRPITGTLNAGDIAAVKKWQGAHGLKADGYWGPATTREFIKQASPASRNRTLRRGARGDAVKLVQYAVGVPLRDIDGIWGEQTDLYVEKAQRHVKIEPDRIFGAQSRERIIRHDHK